MLRFAADENFNNDILRGLKRRSPEIDIIRIQDCGLRSALDPEVLAWCAEQNRILLSHDIRTITRYAYERAEHGLPMPGVFEVRRLLPMAQVIEGLLIVAEASLDGEWQGQVRYLPI